MRRMAALALVPCLLVSAAAFAGPDDHEDMMTQMMNCEICRNMAVHMDELGPVMQHELVTMNDGMAMRDWVTDPSKVAVFREATSAMHTAAASCMSYTPEQAKAKLCTCCQGMLATLQAGATMSVGDTSNGDLCVLTSSDPAVQKQIAEVQAMMEERFGS